jgi:DNA excision repair protein ERCC-2
MDFVSSTAMEKPVCINATTGFGKTPCILSALLPFRRRIIWAVRTGNESDRPIEELKAIDERASRRFFGLSYRGKKDMCLLKEGMD